MPRMENSSYWVKIGSMLDIMLKNHRGQIRFVHLQVGRRPLVHMPLLRPVCQTCGWRIATSMPMLGGRMLACQGGPTQAGVQVWRCKSLAQWHPYHQRDRPTLVSRPLQLQLPHPAMLSPRSTLASRLSPMPILKASSSTASISSNVMPSNDSCIWPRDLQPPHLSRHTSTHLDWGSHTGTSDYEERAQMTEGSA